MSHRTVAGSTQSQVFEAVREAGEITVKALQTVLAMPGELGYARIYRTTYELMRAGYIKRSAPGTFKYVRSPKDIDYSKSQKRMIRVIRIRTRRNEPFTARILAEIADCSLNGSQRYIHFLVTKGFLARVGYYTISPNKAKMATYLALEEKLNDEWPILRRQRKTESLDKITAAIREKAFAIGRTCQVDAASFLSVRESLQALLDLVDTGLKEITKVRDEG